MAKRIPFNAREIRQALEDEVTDIVRQDAEAITRAVVLATPVGNPALWQSPPAIDYLPGTHRGGWLISIGATGFVQEGLTPLDTSGGPTIAKAFQLIRRWSVGRGRLILSNDKPAIIPLNEGWSSQAPVGFIEQAVAIAHARSDSPVSKELP